MIQIEIVSHCWRYSRLLCYQLSSILLAPPEEVAVRVTVFFCPEDADTVGTVSHFADRTRPRSISWNFQSLERPLLLRRSIGRNQAALATTADIMWFADCDYLFRRGCLDSLPAHVNGRSPLYFPQTVLASKSNDIGDAYVGRVVEPAVVDVDEGDFSPDRMNRAIGGIQIVPGSAARRRGYLPNSAVDQRHAKGSLMTDFESDVRFRQALGCSGKAIQLPGIFRLRHSEVRRCGKRL